MISSPKFHQFIASLAFHRAIASNICSDTFEQISKLVTPLRAQATLGDRLFENALVYANRSLYGPFIRQMVNGTLPRAAFKYYLRLGLKTARPLLSLKTFEDCQTTSHSVRRGTRIISTWANMPAPSVSWAPKLPKLTSSHGFWISQRLAYISLEIGAVSSFSSLLLLSFVSLIIVGPELPPSEKSWHSRTLALITWSKLVTSLGSRLQLSSALVEMDRSSGCVSAWTWTRQKQCPGWGNLWGGCFCDSVNKDRQSLEGPQV